MSWSDRQRRRASVPTLSRFALALLLLALGLTLGGCEGVGSFIESYAIEGRVTEEAGAGNVGPAIENATVTFVSDTGFSQSTRTNGDGRYQMVVESDVNFGQVRAEASSYDPAEATVYFDTPERRIDLTLRPSTGE